MQELREAAFQRFSDAGFPTTHDEEWRFTNVAPIARTAFRVGSADTLICAPEAVEELDLEDGASPPGALRRVRPQRVRGSQHGFREQPGPRDRAARPERRGGRETHRNYIRGCGAGHPVAVHPRTLILVGANAQCSIVETYKGEGFYFTNAVTEISAGDGAVVDHYKVQLEDARAYHVATLQAAAGPQRQLLLASPFRWAARWCATMSEWCSPRAPRPPSTASTSSTARSTWTITPSSTTPSRTAPATSCTRAFWTAGPARCSTARIIVRKDAQKTDSKQTNKNLVLSDEAVIDTKPELQILADDVRCTHGATIGQLDAESMFYLQSRGIGREDARNLLIYAFAQDIADRIKVRGAAQFAGTDSIREIP